MIAIKEREQYIVRMRICAHQFVGVVPNMGGVISKSHVAINLQGGLQSSNGGESDNPEE